MRLLHTSDWHLGRTLHGVDLLDHQAAYLEHLVDLVRTDPVDAVLVAGDVYDRAIPPVEAVQLLSATLARLAEHTTVVLTPGNHDSAARLGFGAELMRERVRVRAQVGDLATPVVLPSEDGDALVYALPYLDPDVVRRRLDAPARSHESVMTAATALVRADLARRTAEAAAAGRSAPRSVVMAHAFVIGGEPSDSERDIRVGGVDHVPAGVFAGVDYVALGHLHGPQVVGSGRPGAGAPGEAGGAHGDRPATLLRYSGSPLAYSFSELHQAKSTTLVELPRGGGAPVVTLLPAPVPRRLAEIAGPLDELLGPAGAAHTEDWLRVTVTDAHRPPDLFRRVRERFPHALVIQHRPPERTGAAPGATQVTAAHDPLEVAAEFVAHVCGAEPTDAEHTVLRRAYEDVVALDRSA
ncbi:exonuclease SbcCD subunit D [Cellulomonas cellasea]|uniref:Nuclease SbcCD subunit D n=2 Tax=Cellulomonas cellasea TaxID=43670 RepID=A0A0A0B6W7_9CELL|nr:exonuclease SbcCD subunit D C-terminal domain-containing protein [Cellulomonas cellasea]KGM01534.1 exodeoxyribonuclease I [Cellulomonas cellasea DSM 20118]GEA87084.1 nuclease SbcCD subunit D [Cellulomonas cellasea]